MTETELKVAVTLPTFLPILLFILITFALVLGIKLYKFMKRTNTQLETSMQSLNKNLSSEEYKKWLNNNLMPTLEKKETKNENSNTNL